MGIEIPYKELSEELLQKIVADFVLREGTDYGHKEISLEIKINQVIKQIKSGRVRILYDEKSESCNLVES